MRIEEIKEKALGMDKESRADLARELLTSLEDLSASEIEALWVHEAIQRDEELDAGTARSFPADDVFIRARARRK